MMRKNNYNVISALRVLACLLIVRGHYFKRFEVPPILGRGPITGAGPVVIFFIISGFLAYDGFDRVQKIPQYYKNRALRIIPGYWIVLIMCIIVEQIIGLGFEFKLGFWGWTRYFLFINMLVPSWNFNEFNNLFGFWTMGCFPLFYLLTPFLYRLVKRRSGMYELVVVSVVLNLISRFAIPKIFLLFGFDDSGSFSNLSPFSTLYLFSFGMMVAYARKSDKEKKLYFCLD